MRRAVLALVAALALALSGCGETTAATPVATPSRG